MPPRFLINDDGSAFDSGELEALRVALEALVSEDRTQYRNENATEIANDESDRMLIVSGPGTGKSTLFLSRIVRWIEKNPEARIFVTSFVRKLVADLQGDVDGDARTAAHKDNIAVSTLHKLARSLVERNHGTKSWPYKPHFRIIAEFWKGIVWDDVIALAPDLNSEEFPWRQFAKQLHTTEFDESPEWKELLDKYLRLCQYFNAAGFDDMILRAGTALREQPQLVEHDHFIIDEYQDFNPAEQRFIDELVKNASSILIVGDDEQVLYENLKASTPALIREMYVDDGYTKAMLPFCGRSSFHITKAADGFIRNVSDDDCIEKIYLPIRSEDEHAKVQVVACATPATAVDFVKEFISDHQDVIEQRRVDLQNGNAKDAFLLILTPARNCGFYREAADELLEAVAAYQADAPSFSEDYFKLLTYYSLAKYPEDNFTFRKILHYEKANVDDVRALIRKGLELGQNLCDIDELLLSQALGKAKKVQEILEKEGSLGPKLEEIIKEIAIDDVERLETDIGTRAIVREENMELAHEDDEEAELEELEPTRMAAVELISIIGSKGLSADHVVVIGFDNANMNYVTQNALYVAMTRPRHSLHLITARQSKGGTTASEYLNHIPAEHLEFNKYVKTGHLLTKLPNKAAMLGYLSSLGKFKKKAK